MSRFGRSLRASISTGEWSTAMSTTSVNAVLDQQPEPQILHYKGKPFTLRGTDLTWVNGKEYDLRDSSNSAWDIFRKDFKMVAQDIRADRASGMSILEIFLDQIA